jgi:hypothetical protein
MPRSAHTDMPSRSVVNLNTFALTVCVVSSSSSPSPSTSPSPPARPGDSVRASPSSCAPSVKGVSARDVDEGASRFVDAGVVAPDDAGGAGAKLKPKPEPELGAADGAVWDGVRDGEPKEKPMLPALGEGVPSLATPAATPNTNGDAVVAAVVAEPKPAKGEEDGLAGELNELAPNTLLCEVVLSFSFSLSLSQSFSVDFAPNMLPAPEEEVVLSPKSFAPGGMLSANGEEPNGVEAGWSFSLSFPSVVDELPDPKSADDFGGPPNSEVPLGWLLPKGEVLEVVLADADAPKGNEGCDGGAGPVSFGVRNTAGLKGEDEEAAVNAPNGDDEAAGAGLVSEDAGGKLKGEVPAADAAGLGVKPVPVAGVTELAVADGAEKPAKLDGGTGIAAEVEVLGLPNENGLVALEALRAVD